MSWWFCGISKGCNRSKRHLFFSKLFAGGAARGSPAGVVTPRRVRSVDVAVGEITGSGPPRAAFAAGRRVRAQPELYGPTTASTAGVRA